MSNVKRYFEKNSHLHVYHNDPQIYSSIIGFIKKTFCKKPIKILDVGCGEAPFIRSLMDVDHEVEFFGTDISINMIKRAKNHLHKKNINLFVSDGFNLPIIESFRFHVIHADSVLHHIIGPTKEASKELVKKILSETVRKLADDGFLIIEEVYYDSYLYKKFTSAFIFYLLKCLNFFHVDAGKLFNEFSLGLEVNFYNELELNEMLGKYGSVNLVKRIEWPVPRLYRVFLLKKYGHITYVIKIDGEKNGVNT